MFNRGDRVHHTLYGDGQITAVKTDTEVEVYFKHGDPENGKVWINLPKDSLSPRPRPVTALSTMVEKLDNKRPDSAGYVTYTPEIIAILSELSKGVPANVFLEQSEFENEVNVTIKLGFTLERDLL